MQNLTSQTILEQKMENVAQRCLFKALGYTDYELSGRPLIGVFNAWNTICPGHYNLKELGEFVKKGIYANGGTAVEFGITGPCDGVVDGDVGMYYILPSREVICDAIELQTQTAKLDGIVLLGSCDKIVPALLMAAARLDIPAIVLNGGPMLGGIEFDDRKSDQTSADEAIGMYTVGKVTKEQVMALEDVSCPTVGSCSFLGTANTMCCVAESLGMSLPGSALIPAVYSARRRVAFETGRKICDLVKAGITARQIITAESIRNTVRLVSGICGSTNAAIHLSAIAREAEADIDVMQAFKTAYYEVPQVVKVNPSGPADMEAYYQAGGIPYTQKALAAHLNLDVMTCTGRTLKEELEDYHSPYPENPNIIRGLDEPFNEKGAIAVLQGNLAPYTAVTKPGAFDPSLYHFEGKAKTFDCEEDAIDAILGGRIEDGDVIVIRYEGPKGGPGMREMYKAMKFLYGIGKATTTALVTDGRFSGTNNGCFVGHVSPEAADGGPIAIVEDGDIIVIDVERGLLELKVEPEVIEERMKSWKRPVKDIPRGYLRLYAQASASAAEGAVIDYERLERLSRGE